MTRPADLAAAAALAPEGTIEFITGLIEAGEWPAPGPGLAEMDAWLERCRLAGSGELRLYVGQLPAACRPELFSEEFDKRLSQLRAGAEARKAAGELGPPSSDAARAAAALGGRFRYAGNPAAGLLWCTGSGLLADSGRCVASSPRTGVRPDLPIPDGRRIREPEEGVKPGFACTRTRHVYGCGCPAVTAGLDARWRRTILAGAAGWGPCTFRLLGFASGL